MVSFSPCFFFQVIELFVYMLFIRGKFILTLLFWFPYSNQEKGVGRKKFVVFFFKSLLFNCFFFIYFLLLLFWFVLSLILFVSVCVSVSCPLTFCLRYKNNSPILCQLFWPTSFLWQPFSEMFLEFTIFSYIWKSVSKIHEKCGTIGVHS